MAELATEDLKGACVEARLRNPNNCSGLVRHVARMMGYELPVIDANHLIDYFNDPANKWEVVDETSAQTAADANQLVVAGKKNATGSGHVAVVYPGGKIKSGGYTYTYKDGKTLTAADHGSYPRMCGTGASRWPGVDSDGTKSMFDAWASDVGYAGVKYWKAPGKAAPK